MACESSDAVCFSDTIQAESAPFQAAASGEGEGDDVCTSEILPRIASSRSQVVTEDSGKGGSRSFLSCSSRSPSDPSAGYGTATCVSEGAGLSQGNKSKDNDGPRISFEKSSILVRLGRALSRGSSSSEGSHLPSHSSWLHLVGHSVTTTSSQRSITSVASPTYSVKVSESSHRRIADQKWHKIDVSQFSENESDEQVANLLSFVGCETLLRATPLATVASNFGGLFRNAEGTAATYELSEVSATIDAFVSHNWSVPRRVKFAVLAYHFNFLPTGLACLVLVLVLGIATYLRCVPTIPNQALGAEKGFLCELCIIPTAFLVMVFWWDAIRRLGFRGPKLFVDKSCIHQTDMDVQRQAIAKLGAFIGVSKQMVAIFGEEYLSKLWTVYEVASFLTLHPTEDLKICPTSLPKLAFGLAATSWLVQVLSTVINIFIFLPHAGQICTGLSLFLLAYILRDTSRRKEAIKGTIAQFTVKNCLCTDEADRAAIYQNIAILMRKTLRWSDDVPQEELLAAFEQGVREELPAALRQQMGNLVFPYRHTLFLSALHQLPFLVDSLMLIPTMEFRYACVFVATHLAWAFALLPTTVLTLQVTAALNLQLKGLQEVMWYLGSTAGVVFVFALLNVVSFWAEESDAGLTALAVLVACTSLLNRGILHSNRGTKPVKPGFGAGHGGPARTSKRRRGRRTNTMSPKNSTLSRTISGLSDVQQAVHLDCSAEVIVVRKVRQDDGMDQLVTWV